ncbi:MAG TPA: tyrosine--tRNA ligase [Candidatus Binatia bacterium]|nr:tyrosine--tRNA ligase [Candidatus Binatia bacterium]
MSSAPPAPDSTTAHRAALIERNLAELLTRDELLPLLDSGLPLRHYIGWEISGQVHLGGGLVLTSKIHDLQQAGVECTVFLADWHTWINDKLGGDRDRIRRIALGYFGEALRAGLVCVGGDPDALRVVLASDLYADGARDYWATVIEVAKHTSLARMQRSITIMGRAEGEQVDFAKLLYPAMQAADIFTLGVHLAHAGMDQRKAHVVARDVATKMRINALHDAAGRRIKPLAVHSPLLPGLLKPDRWPVPPEQRAEVLAAMKMSKSKRGSAIFIHDSPDAINRKLRAAFCPPEEVELNPIIDYIDQLCFRLGDAEFRVDRTAANGGTITFHSTDEVADAYRSGALHPMDAKAALADRLIARLEPARRHFADPERAEALHEVIELTS